MNKEQFAKILLGFVAPRMIEALVTQAEGKGYFEVNEKALDELEEMQELQEMVDEMVDGIGQIIIKIANDNREFICTACLRTASELFQIMENYAREEDCDSIREQFASITGRDIDE